MNENIKVRWLTDHEGTKVAPKTFSSQVYNEDGTLLKDKVDASIADVVETLNEAIGNKANKTDIVQADLNQNDPTALDYVKNRTHWVEDDGETIHPLDEKYLPETIATKGYVEELYTKLNSNTVLGFYCVEDVTIVINGISKVYPANSNVQVSFIEGDTFEIIPTSDNSILALTAFPGALGTYYSWLEGVQQFSNILFDMNLEEMYTKWSQGNQGAYHVQFAQYANCIFWSDNPYISDVSKRTNYTLCSTTQLPLCYSNIPDNTFKSFYLAFGVNSDPNWSNPAYKESFAKATWATQAFSYYGARIVGFPGHDSTNFTIALPKDCRGLMFDARNIECAGTFDAVNTTNFGAKSGSWREAFGDCISLRRLYIKNLKVSLNISWSPVDYDSIYYIIAAAANTSAITISVSPYTYNLLGPSDFELATSKNITIALLSTNYVEDRRLSDIANKADKSYVDEQIANIPQPDLGGYATEEFVQTQITSHNADIEAHADILAEANNYTDGRILEEAGVRELGDTNTLKSAKTYTDEEIAKLVNSAPETLDTLGELATALEENADVVEVLNDAIANKADRADVAVADWLQNDETAPDYVKNRTHWVDKIPSLNTIIGETTETELLNTWQDPYGGYNYYIVKVDGVEYECEVNWETGLLYLGDSRLDNNDQSNPMDVPFCVYIEEIVETSGDSWFPEETYTYNWYFMYPDNNQHTIEITGVWLYEEYHKLDENYIPDTIARKSQIPTLKSPDWNQNSTYGTDYIKNRTHWVDAKGVIHKLDNQYLNYNVEGQTFTVNNETMTAGTGAEVFNDYEDNIATGQYSHAEGFQTIASGNYSHAEGYLTKVTDDKNVIAESSNLIDSPYCSHAEGYGSIASGPVSHAEGNGTTASGFGSHAEGRQTKASGFGSHAEGSNTTASGSDSHAEGSETTASGINSHAEGSCTIASAYYAHAEGWQTTASNMAAHAEGKLTTASGYYSHAEGKSTEASDEGAHSEGLETIASSSGSHAEGKFTIAASASSHVQGIANIEDANNVYAHIVGNGINTAIRSNAHTLDWDGNAWFSGDVYTGSTSGKNKDEGSKKLATEEYVNNHIVSYTAITLSEIDEICGASIYAASEVAL